MNVRWLPTALFTLVLGCGGDAVGGSAEGGSPDASSHGASSGDAGLSDGAPADGASPADAGGCPMASAGADGGLATGRVPMNHRAEHGPGCPQQRAPISPEASTCDAQDASSCGDCVQDSDCTQGDNGRCESFGTAYGSCSYDECFQDADCKDGLPCDCRPTSASEAPNSCLQEGNCSVDSDCGPGGYCSPSALERCQCLGIALCGDSGDSCSVNGVAVPCSCGDSCGHGYYCHTRCDECVDDSDCGGQGTCSYDTLSLRWDCSECWPVP